MSAKEAMDRYYVRHMKELDRSAARRKNEKPEFEVKKAVLAWLETNGFSCNAIESKATYSAREKGQS